MLANVLTILFVLVMLFGGVSFRFRGRGATGAEVSAQAEVLAAEPAGAAAGSGVMWKLTLAVKPAGKAEFTAQVKQLLGTAEQPVAGTTLSVLYNPKRRRKVVIDPHSAAVSWPSIKAGALPSVAQDGAGSPFSNVLRMVGFLLFPRRAVRRALGPGVSSAGTLQMASLAASNTRMVQPANGSLDEVAKLADLRDRGVLSSEEFEMQKQRLLAG